jgi:hypothetical protein
LYADEPIFLQAATDFARHLRLHADHESEIRIGEGAVEDEGVDNEDMFGAVEGTSDGSQEHGREVGHGEEMLVGVLGKWCR